MPVTIEKTKISQGNQVVVPAKIREKFNLEPGDEIIWALIKDEIRIKFLKKKEGSLSSLIGKIDMGPTSPKEIDRTVSGR